MYKSKKSFDSIDVNFYNTSNYLKNVLFHSMHSTLATTFQQYSQLSWRQPCCYRECRADKLVSYLSWRDYYELWIIGLSNRYPRKSLITPEEIAFFVAKVGFGGKIVIKFHFNIFVF